MANITLTILSNTWLKRKNENYHVPKSVAVLPATALVEVFAGDTYAITKYIDVTNTNHWLITQASGLQYFIFKPKCRIDSKIDWNNPNEKIGEYFTVADVTQNDSRRIPVSGSKEEANILKMATELDKVRKAWSKPIGVTSWYRPPTVNAEVGGVANSQHITGAAADIYDVAGDNDMGFEQWLDNFWGDKALGYGVASGRGFTHCDLRTGRIRWSY